VCEGPLDHVDSVNIQLGVDGIANIGFEKHKSIGHPVLKLAFHPTPGHYNSLLSHL
jgi:hypothetical protein